MFDFDRDYLTDAEFDALPRHPSGEIVDLWAWGPMLTMEQRIELVPDDAARLHDFDAEAAFAMAEEIEALGILPRHEPVFLEAA